MEFLLISFILFLWISSEAILIWWILNNEQNSCRCPYGCSADERSDREGTKDQPNFYHKS